MTRITDSGFFTGKIYCSVCGSNILKLEGDTDETVVELICNDGHRNEWPTNHPRVQWALENIVINEGAQNEKTVGTSWHVPVIFLIALSLCIWWLDGWQWAVSVPTATILLLICYKISPKFFTEP